MGLARLREGDEAGVGHARRAASAALSEPGGLESLSAPADRRGVVAARSSLGDLDRDRGDRVHRSYRLRCRGFLRCHDLRTAGLPATVRPLSYATPPES